MNDKVDAHSALRQDSTRPLLNDLRGALLHLHKILLDMERRDYEHMHGPTSPGGLLQRVIQDGQFAWLRSLSGLIVSIDELLDTDESIEDAQARALLLQTSTLLVPSEEGSDFSKAYYQALRREPAAAQIHREIKTKLIDKLA